MEKKMINDNLDKINHFKGRDNGRKKYSKRSLFRTWNNLRATRRRDRNIRENSEQYCFIRESEYSNRKSYKIIPRKFETKKNYQSNQRLSRNNKQSLGTLYYIKNPINEYLIYVESFIGNILLDKYLLNEYNFANIHLKGTNMQKITLDFSKIVNDEDIEMELESKLKGLIFLLDTLVLTGNVGEHKFQKDGFYALHSLASSILDDVDELKINVEYMHQLLHKFKDNHIVEVA